MPIDKLDVYNAHTMRKKVDGVNIAAGKKVARIPAQSDAVASSYHHGNLRQALIDAGLALLEDGETDERGELSLRELARRVGVSANASYRHFADKEALLLALAAEGFRIMAASQAKAAQAERQPMQRHRAAGSAYIRFARDNPALFRLMFGRFSSGHHNKELDAAAKGAFEALRAGVARALELKPEEERVTVAAVRSWALVHGLSLLLLDGQINKLSADPEVLIEAILQQSSASTGY